MTIAERIRWARSIAGLSSRKLDKAAGLRPGHVSMIESRDAHNLDTETATKLSHALGVSLDWLVNGDGREPSERALRAVGERAAS